MPRSKRAKVVHLTKTKPKTREHNVNLYNTIREVALAHTNAIVFSVENMRNTYLKDVRAQLSPQGRLFYGKTKVMGKALGTSVEDEALPGLSQLAGYIKGDVGLIFTSQDVNDVLEYLESYTQVDFARAGIEASRTFEVPEGVVYSRGGDVPADEDVPVEHSLETTLRGWGMPTRLIKGKVTLDAPFQVCSRGQVLNSHQTALLKMFGITMAEFRIRVLAYYNAATQEVTEVEGSDS